MCSNALSLSFYSTPCSFTPSVEMSKATKKLSSWQDEVNARAPAFTFSSTRLFGADLKLLEESNGKLPSRVDHRAKYKVTLPSEESEDVVQIKVSMKNEAMICVFHPSLFSSTTNEEKLICYISLVSFLSPSFFNIGVT